MRNGKSLPVWTDQDKAKALRAFELYGGHARMAVLCEFPSWPAAKFDAWRNRVYRLQSDGFDVEFEGELRIESDPKTVLAEWQAHAGINAPLPPALAAVLEKAPPLDTTLPPDDPEVMKLERRVAHLEEENTGLRRKLRKAFRRETFGEAIAQVIHEVVEPIPPVEAPALVKRTGDDAVTPVDAVAILSDEHADEVVTVAGSWGMEDYDFDVFRARLQTWAEKLIGWTVEGGWLPAHRIERILVPKLGDAINGSIHDAEFRNHFGNSIRAALATGDAEAHALQYVYRETGIPINVVGLSGNHPRTSVRKDYHDPHQNLDFLVGTQIATRLRDEEAISVHLPRSYTALAEVRGHLFAMNHGDDVRGSYGGIPWYGFTRRNTRVQATVGAMDAKVSYFLYGHYHQPAKVPTAGAVSYHNGAFPATSAYALESLSAGTKPSQTLLIVDEPHGVQMEIPLFLRNGEREHALREGSFVPAFGGESILDQVDRSTRRPSGLVTVH